MEERREGREERKEERRKEGGKAREGRVREGRGGEEKKKGNSIEQRTPQ